VNGGIVLPDIDNVPQVQVDALAELYNATGS
jgi:hypothetical protein